MRQECFGTASKIDVRGDGENLGRESKGEREGGGAVEMEESCSAPDSRGCSLSLFGGELRVGVVRTGTWLDGVNILSRFPRLQLLRKRSDVNARTIQHVVYLWGPVIALELGHGPSMDACAALKKYALYSLLFLSRWFNLGQREEREH